MKQTGITKDLNKSEEVVLVTIALNPDVDGEEMIDELDTSEKVFSHCVNTLLEKEYIELVEDGENYWKISELGRLALNRLRVMMKFDLIFAKKKDSKKSILQRLQKKKKRFDAAHSAVKRRQS